MENLKKDMFQTSLEILKTVFRDYPPSSEVKHFVETGESVVNEATVSQVLYYLFTIISKEKTTDILMVCWPVTGSKTRAHFRMGVKKMVAWINAEWPESRLQFAPSQLQSPKTTVLYRILLKLCLLTIKVHARKKYLEDTMTIPELNFLDCDQNEKLSLYKNKVDVRIRSFTRLKNELDKEYQNKEELLRKLENKNLALKKALDENGVLSNLVKTCPKEYQSKLLSDQDWKTAVFEWSKELDKIEKSCEKKNTILEEVVPEICRLSAMKNICGTDNTTLDAEEILSSCNNRIFKTCAKENQLSTFNKTKLSLPHVIKVCKITSEKTKCFLENVPPIKLLESGEEAEKAFSDLENLHEFFSTLSNEISGLKSDLIKRCSIIEQSLIAETQARKLSNFFQSPLMRFSDEVKDSPEFSSPGLTGAQLLEETKKQLKMKSGNVNICEKTPLTILVSEENHTPVSRKSFQIPRLIKNKPILTLDSSENKKGMARSKTELSEVSNKNFATEDKDSKKKFSSSPLAISLLQKQAWEPPQSKVNTITYPKPTILSSTLCSEPSKKNLRESEENSVESLSPILKSCISECTRDTEFISTDSDESEDFFGPASLMMPGTSRESLKIQKGNLRKGRPSIEALIEKYKSIMKKIEEDEDE